MHVFTYVGFHWLREFDVSDHPLIIHVSQKIQPPLVACVIILVVEYIQSDESGKHSREH